MFARTRFYVLYVLLTLPVFLSRQIQKQHLDVSEAKIPAFQNLNYSSFCVFSQNWEERVLYALRISLRLFFCPSDHPSVRMKQFGYYWMDFHEIWYFRIFPKSVDKFKFLWTLTRITSNLLEDNKTVYHTALSSHYNEKCFREIF